MKKFICYILKCIISGLLACAVLSGFALLYYNPPVAITQSENITNFKYIQNKNWSYMLEGFGYGKTDDYGYNNAHGDMEKQPDIVFMGSSQMEALQVPEKDNFVYLLNQKLNSDNRSDNDLYCYNLGISEHFFEVSVSNAEYAAKKFKGAKYIVFEAFDTEFDASQLDRMLNKEYHKPMEEKSFIHTVVRKIPYIRLLYKKLNEVAPQSAEDSLILQGGEEISLNTYKEKMGEILDNIKAVCNENGAEPIILIHDRISLESGSADYSMNKEYLSVFKEVAAEKQIKLIDAVPEFIKEYNSGFKMPHGFANSTPGTGHLNKTGHRIVSDVLYSEFNEILSK